MRSVVSLLAVAVIVLLSYKLYFSKMMTDAGGTTTPVETIDVVGVKGDLLAIGQAERLYQAEHGGYASMDELVSSGALSMRKAGRDGYTYDVETSANGFQVVAHCPSAKFPGCTNYAVDQTMEIQPEP
jgi:hypothetical protein